MPTPDRPLPLRVLAGTWGLAAALLSIYYGNAFIERLLTAPDRYGSVLYIVVMRFLVHGLQNTLTVAGWQILARKLSPRLPQIEDALNVLVPPLAFLAMAYVLPLLWARLAIALPLHPLMLFLLLLLCQLLSLYIDNPLDQGITLALWMFSFQSLELLSGIALVPQGPGAREEIVSLGLTGLILFASFLVGVVCSSWLLAKYSIRLSALRASWISSELPQGESATKEATMLDLNNLVHDLKNSIAVIKGTTRLIEKECQTDGPAPSIVSEKTALILKVVDYMETMVRELLTEEERTAVTLSDFCDLIDQHSRSFPWGQETTISVAEGAGEAVISVNRVRLLRAVLNVLDNAWRSNEAAGGEGILLLARRNDAMAEIEVIDNGVGYQRSQTAGTSGWGSTGLGLTFTRRVVSLHGGLLLIANRTDQQRGARVAIYLPVHQPLPQEEEREECKSSG